MIPTIWETVVLLLYSNTFMTFAWYAYLRNLHDKAWYIAALVSWGIALFESLLQAPANRLGYGVLNLAQLKILTRNHHPVGIHAIRRVLHAPAGEERLSLGWCLFARGRAIIRSVQVYNPAIKADERAGYLYF